MDGNETKSVEKPKKKLFVAIPVYGTVDIHFFTCWNHLLTDGVLKFPVQLDMQSGDSLVSRARNTLTHRFLESDSTHMLFIDSDLVFSPQHINQLMERDVDLVGGVYCKKQEGDVQVVCNSLGFSDNRPDGLSRVGYVGTGFMMISRKVFELMIQEFGKDIWYLRDPDHKVKEYDFWRVGTYAYSDGTRRYLSEDWYFCQKWMDIGGEVWMDMRCVLKHSGNALYPLSYQEKQLLERHTRPIQNVAVEPAPIPQAEAATH